MSPFPSRPDEPREHRGAAEREHHDGPDGDEKPFREGDRLVARHARFTSGSA